MGLCGPSGTCSNFGTAHQPGTRTSGASAIQDIGMQIVGGDTRRGQPFLQGTHALGVSVQSCRVWSWAQQDPQGCAHSARSALPGQGW